MGLGSAGSDLGCKHSAIAQQHLGAGGLGAFLMRLAATAAGQSWTCTDSDTHTAARRDRGRDAGDLLAGSQDVYPECARALVQRLSPDGERTAGRKGSTWRTMMRIRGWASGNGPI